MLNLGGRERIALLVNRTIVALAVSIRMPDNTSN